MKHFRLFTGLLALTALFSLSACGKSEFGVTENTEKHMLITAENADQGGFMAVGTLEANEGDQIVITSNLKKGSIKVEIIGGAENQTINEVPDINKDPILTANVKLTDMISGGVPAGSYMMKATCLEKATGTVSIDVKPAN